VKAATATVVAVLTAWTVRATEYHVSKAGRDGYPGSETQPFRTISAAAQAARAGDVITVHAGVYRERVNPPRGGVSHEKRIVYQAAQGETVVIKGSETVKGWKKVADGVWTVVLPNRFFGDFNPYSDVIGGEWHGNRGYPRHTGTVYLDGRWLDEARSLEQVLPVGGAVGASDDRVLGGKTANYPGKAIAGTEEDVLYQTCRYDLGGYRLAVPNGTYRVSLKFCEPHFDASGKRVCDVRIQGKTVLSAFDIHAIVGKFAAHDELFERIAVTDGQLRIDVVNRVSMACISAVVVKSGNYVKRINCGGPAWEDYRPDPASTVAVAHGRPLWYAKVDRDNTTIWAQFKDLDPNDELVEINVRQSVFYPDQPGRNYITVRGFALCQAATPWSGAMSEQIGLIGTHWSRGWVVEDNVISHSMNTGVTLGRYDLGRFGLAMPAVSAPGFVRSIEYALEHGWSKKTIGGHVVRNNHISHCEKNGIHGSLGGIFSTIENNTICDIAVRGWIGGPDVAGLKLLGSNDVVIRNNHIYRCGAVGGIWLDWMAQGTRVTGNLLHENSKDLFMEVDHGPFLIDHNLFLSGRSLEDWSNGGAYAHNLFAGTLASRRERRKTPYFKAHTVADMKLSDISRKDQRFRNNLFAGRGNLSGFGNKLEEFQSVGNVYLAGARPSPHDREALVVAEFDPRIKLEEKPDGWWLEMAVDHGWVSGQKRTVVTSQALGNAKVPDAPFEKPDGTPYRLDTDYLGSKRSPDGPSPGPLELSGEKLIRVKVWPK
jgi:alpha-L-arabinofuranosidase